MKLPKQVPAVERKVNKHAAVPDGSKVKPSAWPKDPWLQQTLGWYGV